MLEKKKEKAVKTAEKFSKQASMDADVEPMSAEEMKALIEQAKASEGDELSDVWVLDQLYTMIKKPRHVWRGFFILDLIF